MDWKRHAFLLMNVLLVSLLTACFGADKIASPNGWEVNDFTFTNQEEEEVSLSSLKGQVWVSDFIFTSCSTICPTLTANMAKLQQLVKAEDLEVTFVSFSVDPEVDSPNALKNYGRTFTDDFSNWHFLTGYSLEEIKEFALSSFKTPVIKSPDSNQVTHGTRFYLVDQNGTVMKDYKGSEGVPYDQIINDIKTLIK